MTLTITKGQHKRQDSEVQSALASCALISPSATSNNQNVQQRGTGQKLGLSRESSSLACSAPPSPGRCDEHSSPVAEAIFWFQGVRVRVKHTPTRISWKPVGPDTSCCMEGVRKSYKVPYDEVLSAWQLPKTKMCSCLCAKDNSLIIYTFSRKPRSPSQWVSSEHILYSSSPELVKEWVTFINAGVALNVDRPKQLLVFVNPFSGAKRAHAVWEKEALPVFQKARIKYQLVETTQMDHAKELLALMKAEELAQYSGVVAVGGDGLFQELIRGLIAQRARGGAHAAAAVRIRVGHIPAGSTDAVAYSLHGSRSAETAALHIALGDRTALDVARVDGEDGSSRHFVCQAGYGFMGDVMRASESLRWMGPSRYDLSGALKFLQLRTYHATVSYRVAPEPLGEPSELCSYKCETCRLAGLHMERSSRTDGCSDIPLSTSSAHSAYSTGGTVTVLHSHQLSACCADAPMVHGSPSRVRRRSSSDHHNLQQQQQQQHGLLVPLFQQQSQPLYGSSCYTGRSGGGCGDSSTAVMGTSHYGSQRSTSGSLGGTSPKGLGLTGRPPIPSQHPQLQTMTVGSQQQQHMSTPTPLFDQHQDSQTGGGAGSSLLSAGGSLLSAAGGTTVGALSVLSSTLAATVGAVSGSTSNTGCNHLQAAHRAAAQKDASQLQATLISPSAGLGSSSASMPLPITSSGPPSPVGLPSRRAAGSAYGTTGASSVGAGQSGGAAGSAAATAGGSGVNDAHGWTVVEGKFVSIMCVVCPCRSDKSKKGIIPHGHLADGRMYLVMVSACNHVQYLQFLLHLSSRGVYDACLPWVKVVPVTALTVQANGPESVWNVDGELLSSSLVRMRVQRGMIDAFARGVEVVMPSNV